MIQNASIAPWHSGRQKPLQSQVPLLLVGLLGLGHAELTRNLSTMLDTEYTYLCLRHVQIFLEAAPEVLVRHALLQGQLSVWNLGWPRLLVQTVLLRGTGRNIGSNCKKIPAMHSQHVQHPAVQTLSIPVICDTRNCAWEFRLH